MTNLQLLPTTFLTAAILFLTNLGVLQTTMATTIQTPTQITFDADDSQHTSLVRGPQFKHPPAEPLGFADNAHDAQDIALSRTRAVILITTLTGITFVGSMSSGLLTIGLPWIARDLHLPDNLLLW